MYTKLVINMNNQIGNRIKLRREELGLSQEILAKALGYTSRSSINKIELGYQDLPAKKIKKGNDIQSVPGAANKTLKACFVSDSEL